MKAQKKKMSQKRVMLQVRIEKAHLKRFKAALKKDGVTMTSQIISMIDNYLEFSKALR
jgi:hypothetical protein